MNDIRPALRERLKSIMTEMDELSRRNDQLARLKQTVEATLLQEEALYIDRTARPHEQAKLELDEGDDGGDDKSIAAHVMTTLKGGPKTLDQLKQVLGSYRWAREHQSLGRAINFALVGLQKGNHVRRTNAGAWELISDASRK